VPAASAVSVNDDFSACDAAITFWAAYDEPAGFVDVEYDVLINKTLWQDGQNNLFDDLFT
jgi:hypothetical protein